MAAKGLPCAICGQAIDYSLPAGDPMSFELDEIIPVSRYQEGGYATPEQCAQDPANHQPAHRICNQMKSNKMIGSASRNTKEALPIGMLPCVSSVDWIDLYGSD